MDREILFRGKHIHALSQNEHLDGTWVYGYLCDENYINSPELEGEFLINPKTICQYTGLTDKNGRKIFEGDILEIETENLTKKDGYFIAEWSEPGSCFVLCGKSYLAHFDRVYKDCREVIGNIFDSPELLEIKQKEGDKQNAD